MNEKIVGIVLKQNEYRENDCILTVLTQEYGKISLVSKGVKKMTSKNAVSCMPFVVSEYIFDYQDEKTMFTLKNGSLVESNRHIQESLEKMNVAAVIAEIVEKSIPQGIFDEDTNQLFFTLLSFSLRNLNNGNDNFLNLALFLAKTLEILGIAPVVDECAICGNTLINAICIEEGGFVCEDCKKEMALESVEVSSLKKFRLINKAQIENYDILKKFGPWDMEDCEILLKFLINHSGISLESWDFLVSLLEN